VILIQLRVHGIDLALPVSVIQRIIDSRWRYAQPRCCGAIDNQGYRKAASLLVGSDVGKLM
jgi:hypothetical protein